MTKALEARWEKLWKQLVPSMGHCETLEGETMRAFGKLRYRYFNDGDYFFRGYGCETAGPAHAFLVDISPVRRELRPIFKEMENASDEAYEDGLKKALKVIVRHVVSKKGSYTPSDYDMFECQPHFDNEDDEDE